MITIEGMKNLSQAIKPIREEYGRMAKEAFDMGAIQEGLELFRKEGYYLSLEEQGARLEASHFRRTGNFFSSDNKSSLNLT